MGKQTSIIKLLYICMAFSNVNMGIYGSVDRTLDARSKILRFHSHCWSCVEMSGKLLIPCCLCMPIQHGGPEITHLYVPQVMRILCSSEMLLLNRYIQNSSGIHLSCFGQTTCQMDKCEPGSLVSRGK